MAFDEILEVISRDFPEVTCLAITDELYCFGNPDILLLVADRVLDQMDKSLGLIATIAKVEIFGLSLNENTITENEDSS